MSESAVESPENAGHVKRQRLVICFDGTWNNRDSSTNVFHLHNFVGEGEVEGRRRGERMRQLRYYDEGVGTGVLDGVSGGAFGLGLEAKVRKAYNWLVEHYQSWDLDEVFIFGFSRGAYTARSLVGFIVRCGLLRRGAPITVTQLWKAYTEFGEYKAGRRKDRPFRELTDLVSDPWQGSQPRWVDRGDPPPTAREKLLLKWSRRIPIKFLGIYDTVGAMGSDALAIPGLRSRLGIMHNMRLSTMVRNFYHAIAIDEYRSSFVLTPLLQWEGYGEDWDAEESGRRRKRWDFRVQQRWFLGAHSNVGGGYADNRLATYPLAWMLEGARKQNLVLNAEIPDPAPEAQAGERKDSYLEFMGGLWAHIIRAKRNYRRLDPPLDVRGTPPKWLERAEIEDPAEDEADAAELSPEQQASQEQKKVAARREAEEHAGYSLRFVNPTLDDSVLRIAELDDDYAPPNLVSYAEQFVRHQEMVVTNTAGEGEAELDRRGILEKLAARVPVHDWLPTATERGWFVIWALLALWGLSALPALFGLPVQVALPMLCVVGALLPFLDWGESRSTFSLARHPEDEAGRAGPRRRALYDVLMSLRALALSLFAIGLVTFAARFVALGIGARSLGGSFRGTIDLLAGWIWPALLVAVVTAGLALLSDFKRSRKGILPGLGAIMAGLFLFSVVGLVLAVVAGWFSSSLGAPTKDASAAAGAGTGAMAQTANLAGILLILHLAFAAMGQAFTFVRAPMLSSNLGTIVLLQLGGFTPARVRAQLDRWRRKLTPKSAPEPGEATPAQRLQGYLAGSLWRDTLGLIPVYGLALGFGLWVGATHLEWEFLSHSYLRIPFWLWLAGTAVAADLVENAVHLHYTREFAEEGVPGWGAVILATLAATIKFLAFLTSAAIFTAVWIALSGKVISSPAEFGWRGVLAGVLAIPVGLAVGAVYLNLLWRIWKAVKKWMGTADEADAEAKMRSA